MHARSRARAATCSLAATILSCGTPGTGAPPVDGSTGGGSTGAGTTDGAVDPNRATLVHSFGVQRLAAFEEKEPCVQWTLGNDQPIYVNTTTLVNDGAYHHSNWLAVPEEKFVGEDGFFDCNSRGYTELDAAVSGTVVFAQSTQSRDEVQRLPEGVAIKIPPRHKIIAGVHLLNLASVEWETELRMALEIIHPKDVEVIAAAFRLSYFDLSIPPQKRSRFSATCNIADPYTGAVGGGFDLKLYHVLPHTHYLGDYFRLERVGGPGDGEVLFEKTGFDAGANGKAFDPPLDLSANAGLRFSCGYDNWRDVEIGWGIGDQEMCVMLGLADSRALMDISVPDSSSVVGQDGDVVLNEGPCQVFAFPENAAQTLPGADEKDAPLYVPPQTGPDVDLEPNKRCVDADPSVAAKGPATLDAIAGAIFVPGCIFSSCHDAKSPAAGLDLQTTVGLRDRLLAHQPVSAVDLPLVAPGDAERSWLYQIVSRCEPTDRDGNVVRTMPYNAPTLLPDGAVALVRAWINDGANAD
jgi:hypothetical protein